MADEKLIISPAPHIATEENVGRIMFAVVYSLMPAAIAAVYFFGPQALLIILTAVGTSLLTEYVWQRVRNKPITVFDGSAIITGLLLALTLPPRLPLLFTIIGAVVAVSLGKQIFGGLGQNVFNPALVGRAFLQAAFPVQMGKWAAPLAWLEGRADAVTAATPLGLMKFEQQSTDYLKLLIGNVGGSLGETSALALLVGAVYLYRKGYIDPKLPVGILGTVALFSGTLWLVEPARYPDPLFQLLAGGLIIGAFYMATDYVTTPITPAGKIIFAVGTGIIIMVIRAWGGLQEGVMYAILFMNGITPLINRYTRPAVFGKPS